jgi:hypothetical protein
MRGFSLLELLVSTAALLVVAGGIFNALNFYQRSYGSTMLKADMHAGVRGAAELMAQEIGQAGAVPSTSTTLSANVVASALAQTVNVGSSLGIFVGENLQIDGGPANEIVTVTAVASNSIRGIFAKNHNANATVVAGGVFPQGIITATSTATTLQLFGDINADGTLVYVEYVCDPTTNHTLTRSITPITAANKSAAVVLVQGLVANPAGAACFTYSTTASAGFTFATNVGLTLTTQTSDPDPQTGSYDTMTKSFLNLSPRNVVAGLALAQAGSVAPLQQTPPGVPMS